MQHIPQTDNQMDNFGADLLTSERELKKRQEQRFRRGECKQCGRKTHKVNRRSLFGSSKREPLTVEGEVMNGRCLRCHPLEGYLKREPQKPAIPDTLEVEDDMTVASEITMDPYLTAPPIENPHNSWPARPRGDGAGGRGGRNYTAPARDRLHHMATHFDPVEEDTPITQFGRHADEVIGHIEELENERRAKEREILREQEPHVIRGGRGEIHLVRAGGVGERRISEGDDEGGSESEESIDLWDNHEELLQGMEKQQKQQFHPLAVQHSYSNSEQSISITEDKESLHSSGGRPHQGEDRRSHNTSNTSNLHNQQKFHPLSTVAQFTASELSESMSLNDVEIDNFAITSPQGGDPRSHNTSNSSNLHNKQKFHPLSRVPQFTASELSEESMSFNLNDGDTDKHDKNAPQGRDLKNHNMRTSSNLHNKQKFHPLSTVAQFSASELSDHSMTLNDGDANSRASNTPSVQSSDSDRILRLCHGSRGSLMMEVDSSPPRGGCSSPIVAKTSSKEGDGRRGSATQKERDVKNFLQKRRASGGWLKRLPSSEHEKDKLDSSSHSGDPNCSSAQKRDSNRFSLNRIDKSQAGKLANGERGDSNRFSFNQHKGPTSDTMPPNLEMEMNASKNWDSMDILRDAAAEANGDLDAEVDALFGLGGVIPDAIPPRPNDEGGPTMVTMPPHPPPRKTPHRRASIEEEEEDSDTSASEEGKEGSRPEEDEVDVMAAVLSRGLGSAHEEAALATTITQRRKSSLSQEGMGRGSGAVQQRRLSSTKDIPVIIQAVRSRPMDKKCTERAFQSLFLLATDPDPKGSLARKEILANGGMETLVSAIWDHMQNSQVLLAVFHALWAISVFDGEDEATVSKICECDVLEGLLFAMQSHATDLGIQDSGCDLITRLTGFLPVDTPEFKSAVVLLCTNVKDIDECDTKAYSSCLDALNSLCQLSDDNKREFAKAGNECHSAIIRGLSSGNSLSLETRELACQLFWCITSDRAAVSVLSSNCELLLSRKIIDALKNIPKAKTSVHFFGAACGTLANLALDPNNHSKMIDLGVVPVLCEAIYIYDFSVEVNSAACTALANLSASREYRIGIAAQGGIPALFSAMKAASDNVNVQSEALRALHNLCESSSDAKLAIAADLEIIITSFFRHEGVKYIQQITCSILCRLSSDEKCRKLMIMLPRTYDALAKIMKSNSKKKLVQKAACSVLRNLSKEEEIAPILLSKGFNSLVINAMDTYGNSEELQECACTFIMNMVSNIPETSVEICSEGIDCIIKSMQTIPTSASLQQASCGALYAITKGDAHKNKAISAGAVDAVICLMLVHPNEIEVLKNAVNVLVNLSSLRKCTKTIANAGGISTVIEIMRSNPTSTGLIVGGSRFIQNMALSRREYADEALGGITPILGCMDEHPDCARLVEESCKALRCLVLKSETCRDRLITADGVAVIEKTMEENSTSQRWQTLLLDELFE